MKIDLGWFQTGFDNIVNTVKDVGNWVGDTFFGGSNSTNQTNKSIAEQNIEYQKWANEQNIAFQKEENEITRQREDTAVQRAAQDMTAAGLSKTLAAGSPASAQALSAPQVQAPNNGYQMQKNMAGMNMLNMMREFHFQNEENKRANRINEAQVDLIKAQAAGQNLSNDTFMQNFENEQKLKSSQAFLFGQQADYYNAQTEVEKIVGKNKQREIDAQVDKLIQEKFEVQSRTSLNSMNFSKVSHEIVTEVLKQEGIKLDNKYKEEDFELLVQKIVNTKLEASVMEQNLGIAQLYGYPVGQYPSSLFGILERKGKEAAIVDKSKADFAKGQYSNFMNGYKDFIDGLGNFYDKETDAIQGAGGGLLDFFRTLQNFSILNLLLK